MSSHALAARLGTEAPDGAAADAWAGALDAFLRGVGRPLETVNALLDRHPDFAMGHVLRCAIVVAAKDPALLPTLDHSFRTARHASQRWSRRARRHLCAARAWRFGEPGLAAQRYLELLHEWPDDLIAFRLAQSCLFFLGRHGALVDSVRAFGHAWPDHSPEHPYYLAMAAFAHAENGDAEQSLALAGWALAIEPRFPYAIHAGAHALLDAGRSADGFAWMHRWESHWRGDSSMMPHNLWHLALFELNAGHPQHALDILDRSLMPSSGTSLGDAADATALLWHLQAVGCAPEQRWNRLSDWWATHGVPGFWSLLDIHAAIAFTAAGDTDRAGDHAERVTLHSGGGTHAANLARIVTLPAMDAVTAFASGAYARAGASLRLLRQAFRQAGGSRAQQEVLMRMLTRMGSLHGGQA